MLSSRSTEDVTPLSTAQIASSLTLKAPGTAEEKDAFIEDEVIVTHAPRPLENKLLSQFQWKEQLEKKTYHQIAMLELDENTETRIFYFKKKTTLTELEAVLAEHYRLIVPHSIPATYAVLDDKGYAGVASEKVNNFQALSENPLTPDDLEANFLRADLSFEKLDSCEDRLRALENTAKKLQGEKRYLDKYEAMLIQARAEQARDTVKRAELSHQLEIFLKKKLQWVKLSEENYQQTADCYEWIVKSCNLTEKQFAAFRTLKGLTIGLCASYTFLEDDLHQNNISKDGIRIDFDMSMWPLVYHVNDKGLLASARRKPSTMARTVAEKDILLFPDISVVKPSYWPTRETTLFTDEARDLMKKIIVLANNQYPATAISLFKNLAHHPIVKHYKFVVLLRYILTNESMYEKTARLHMAEETLYQANPFYKVLATEHKQRIAYFAMTLKYIPEFIHFFHRYGEMTFKTFISDIQLRNETFTVRAQLLEAELLANEQKLLANLTEVESAQLLENIAEQKALLKAVRHQVLSIDEVALAFEQVKQALPVSHADEVDICHVAKDDKNYIKVKEIVTNELKNYSSSHMLNLFGYAANRHHDKEAGEILLFISTTLESESSLSPTEKIKVIKNKLEQHKLEIDNTGNPRGDFYNKLKALLANAELWVCHVDSTSHLTTPMP